MAEPQLYRTGNSLVIVLPLASLDPNFTAAIPALDGSSSPSPPSSCESTPPVPEETNNTAQVEHLQPFTLRLNSQAYHFSGTKHARKRSIKKRLGRLFGCDAGFVDEGVLIEGTGGPDGVEDLLLDISLDDLNRTSASTTNGTQHGENGLVDLLRDSEDDVQSEVEPLLPVSVSPPTTPERKSSLKIPGSFTPAPSSPAKTETPSSPQSFHSLDSSSGLSSPSIQNGVKLHHPKALPSPSQLLQDGSDDFEKQYNATSAPSLLASSKSTRHPIAISDSFLEPRGLDTMDDGEESEAGWLKSDPLVLELKQKGQKKNTKEATMDIEKVGELGDEATTEGSAASDEAYMTVQEEALESPDEIDSEEEALSLSDEEALFIVGKVPMVSRGFGKNGLNPSPKKKQKFETPNLQANVMWNSDEAKPRSDPNDPRNEIRVTGRILDSGPNLNSLVFFNKNPDPNADHVEETVKGSRPGSIDSRSSDGQSSKSSGIKREIKRQERLATMDTTLATTDRFVVNNRDHKSKYFTDNARYRKGKGKPFQLPPKPPRPRQVSVYDQRKNEVEHKNRVLAVQNAINTYLPLKRDSSGQQLGLPNADVRPLKGILKKQFGSEMIGHARGRPSPLAMGEKAIAGGHADERRGQNGQSASAPKRTQPPDPQNGPHAVTQPFSFGLPTSKASPPASVPIASMPLTGVIRKPSVAASGEEKKKKGFGNQGMLIDLL
ncbi:hypothetical protein BJ508DRAFT_300385 [Ascobolus immersus RN42]|uniref:Uncharacterized protein n=1 Tax=Ascobolus immersus RN42 TaxID=1160509 RepID=A0A3N4ITF3_ASCIM|nr:hypothetical protein BJ508DRAFT_300385 [Ascobolus immersus RN42]